MVDLLGAGQRFARMAEREMTDDCRITRVVGAPTFNQQTGKHETPDPIEIYSGKCFVLPPSFSEGGVVQTSERPLTLKTYEVRVPRDVDTVKEGDVVEIAESSDPALEGARLYVLDVLFKTHQPQRRIIAEYRHETEDEG